MPVKLPTTLHVEIPSGKFLRVIPALLTAFAAVTLMPGFDLIVGERTAHILTFVAAAALAFTKAVVGDTQEHVERAVGQATIANAATAVAATGEYPTAAPVPAADAARSVAIPDLVPPMPLVTALPVPAAAPVVAVEPEGEPAPDFGPGTFPLGGDVVARRNLTADGTEWVP